MATASLITSVPPGARSSLQLRNVLRMNGVACNEFVAMIMPH